MSPQFANERELEKEFEEIFESEEAHYLIAKRAHEYAKLMAYYRCAIMEVETKFKVLNEEFSLRFDRNPIENIKSRLKRPISIRNKLKKYGYPESGGIDECLEHLSGRIRSSSDFPHEIGVFLGYPTEDVMGFIENKGENFKFCGCWKVYGCEQTARRTFSNYDKCRKFLCSRLDAGADLYQALKIS